MSVLGCGPDCPCQRPLYRAQDGGRSVFSTGALYVLDEVAPGVYQGRYVDDPPPPRAEEGAAPCP